MIDVYFNDDEVYFILNNHYYIASIKELYEDKQELFSRAYRILYFVNRDRYDKP